MERCFATVSPQYDYGRPPNIAGAYRPPAKKRPPYEGASERMLSDNVTEKVTTLVVGDINVTYWRTEYDEWVEEAGMWELTDPKRRTLVRGTRPDATALALGDYFPEGILPVDAGEECPYEVTDVYPAYATD